MPKGKILIIDDDKLIRWSLNKYFSGHGYQVGEAASANEGLEKVKEMIPDLVLVDVRLPDVTGIEVLKGIKEIDPDIITIVMTAYGEVDTAVKALKLGAYDYVTKPLEFEKLKLEIQKALDANVIKKELTYLRTIHEKTYGYTNIIGKSKQMTQVFDMISKVAQADVTILLTGESGTGKDMVARAIHYQSYRGNGPFMEINCAALPEGLLESELFGHEKGAFTDAKELKKGLLETGKAGTVFLDEIGDMPLPMQAKILKVCENKKIRRIGSTRDIEIDVRIIAATNKDLLNMVREGSFREDLYYRLKVMHIHLPPLRERHEDIPLLVNYFIDYYNKEYRARKGGIIREAMEYLLAYDWPGNVRELKNVIERAILLNREGYITVEDFPGEISGSLKRSKDNEYLDLINLSLPRGGISLELIEKEIIRKSLEMTGGNQSKAAQMLRISRDALRYRMDKFNLR